MALGDALSKRLVELEKQFPDMRGRVAAIAEGATLRAVERARALTPPNTYADGDIRGTSMISGELASHWETDSQTVPVESGDDLVTTLANDMEYASYVNDGHRLDPHFVPGLFVDADGLLQRDLEKTDKYGRRVGMMVGTKTSYVEGLHITDDAIDEYRKVVQTEAEKLTREMG